MLWYVNTMRGEKKEEETYEESESERGLYREGERESKRATYPHTHTLRVQIHTDIEIMV